MKYGRKGQRKVKVVFNTMFILDFYSTSLKEMIISKKKEKKKEKGKRKV